MGSRGKSKKKAPTKVRKKVRKKAAAEIEAKKERQAKYKWIFIHGKSVRVRREQPDLIEGISRDEFIRQNAGRIWLKQNEMWEELMQLEIEEERDGAKQKPEPPWPDWDAEPPGWGDMRRSPEVT